MVWARYDCLYSQEIWVSENLSHLVKIAEPGNGGLRIWKVYGILIYSRCTICTCLANVLLVYFFVNWHLTSGLWNWPKELSLSTRSSTFYSQYMQCYFLVNLGFLLSAHSTALHLYGSSWHSREYVLLHISGSFSHFIKLNIQVRSLENTSEGTSCAVNCGSLFFWKTEVSIQ